MKTCFRVKILKLACHILFKDGTESTIHENFLREKLIRCKVFSGLQALCENEIFINASKMILLFGGESNILKGFMAFSVLFFSMS